MKNRLYIIFCLLVVSFTLFAQGVAINDSGYPPNGSAMLDIKSSSKGMLIPRLSNAQIATLGSTLGDADRGLIVFNSDDIKLEYWEGTKWKTMVTKTSSSGSSSDITGFCSDIATDYDGNKYKTVKIGNQCWMAENLKSNHYADGIAITEVYNYENEYGNGLTYGYLYTWAAVMNGEPSSNSNPSGVQGVCPNGWHLPSDDEWKELEMTLGMSSTEASYLGSRGTHNENQKLKEDEDAFLWVDHANRGTNSSGFTALPGGFRSFNGSFYSIEEYAYFWTATVYSETQSFARNLSYSSDYITRLNGNKLNCYSVRCVQD